MARREREAANARRREPQGCLPAPPGIATADRAVRGWPSERASRRRGHPLRRGGFAHSGAGETILLKLGLPLATRCGAWRGGR